MSIFFRLEKPGTITELGHDEICRNAAYVFDTPLKLTTDDLLEMEDGAVYLISEGIRVHIPGKWDR